MSSDQSKLAKILGFFGFLGGSGVLIALGPAIEAAAPGWGVRIIAYLTLASLAASIILQYMGSTPPAGTQWQVAPKVSSGDVAHVALSTPPSVPIADAPPVVPAATPKP
jgi:hypothetical protein